MDKKKREECLKKVRYREASDCSNCKRVKFVGVRDSPYRWWCNMWEMSTTEDMVCGSWTKKEE